MISNWLLLRELYEERAALKEFCGNLSREQAEKEAREEIYGVRYIEAEKGGTS